jgi:hypothetical protein
LTRRKSSLAKIITLCLVLLVALGIIGNTYSVWSEILYINGSTSIGTVSGGLVCGTCSSGVSCQATGNRLDVTVTEAQVDIEYTCQFKVQNTGTIPVKIQSIVVSGVLPEVDVWITGVEEGDQIEDGQFMVGTVHVYLPPGSVSQGETLNLTVIITVIQWNQYVP